MARYTAPEFGLAPEEANQQGMEARATRLALFFNTVSQNPESATIFLKGYASSTEVQQRLETPPYNQVARGHAPLSSLSFEQQVGYTTALVIRHQDDMLAEPDHETAAAMRKEISHSNNEGRPYDRRLLRLQVVAEQLSALNLSQINFATEPPAQPPISRPDAA